METYLASEDRCGSPVAGRRLTAGARLLRAAQNAPRSGGSRVPGANGHPEPCADYVAPGAAAATTPTWPVQWAGTLSGTQEHLRACGRPGHSGWARKRIRQCGSAAYSRDIYGSNLQTAEPWLDDDCRQRLGSAGQGGNAVTARDGRSNCWATARRWRRHELRSKTIGEPSTAGFAATGSPQAGPPVLAISPASLQASPDRRFAGQFAWYQWLKTSRLRFRRGAWPSVSRTGHMRAAATFARF